MKYLFAGAIVFFLGLFTIVQVNSATTKDTADTLLNGIAELYSDNDFRCTAFKVDKQRYVTAKHCMLSLHNSYKIRGGKEWSRVRTVTYPFNEQQDWVEFTVSKEHKEIKALELGCKTPLHVGMPVAYAGHPVPMKNFFSAGYVTTTVRPDYDGVDSDFTTNLTASGGASGSPVMSIETNRVVGILIEGLGSSRNITGAQSIKDVSICD